MIIGITLSALGLLGLVGLGAKKASETSGASLSSVFSSNVPTTEDFIEADKILQNSREFSEKYQLDDVISVDSTEPYISSPEISRPTLGGGNKDDKKNGKIGFVRAFGAGYVVSDILDGVNTVVSNADSLIPFLFLVLGGYVVYKVVE